MRRLPTRPTTFIAPLRRAGAAWSGNPGRGRTAGGQRQRAALRRAARPDRRLLGFNNIELITDRDLELNLREIAEVKRRLVRPRHGGVDHGALPEASWKAILPRVEDTGADAIELNFGCPHGMSERGMGAAVGQVPEYIEMVTAWCKQYCRLPVIVKLTPNITNIRLPAQAAKARRSRCGEPHQHHQLHHGRGPGHADHDPATGGMGSHGGYCGPAVKPIALNMVAEIARDPATRGMPISGIGGIGTWRDALDFHGSGRGQRAGVHRGHGLWLQDRAGHGGWPVHYLDSKGYARRGRGGGQSAVPSVTDWQYLNLNPRSKAQIDQNLCIQCGRCHIACRDTSHQAITAWRDGKRHFEVKEDECVGCNLCVNVCPVPDCITLRTLAPGETDLRTGRAVSATHQDWTMHPNNPMRRA